MECNWCTCVYWILVVGIPALLLHVLNKYRKERNRRALLERWSNTPKDEVILHAYHQGKTIPNAALFPFKLETYLRLTNIKYTLDTQSPTSEKGKSPWISINGKHISDSEFIIDFLNKKFEKNLNRHCDETTLANATILRVMLEEFFMHAIALERFVYGDPASFAKTMGTKSGLLFKLMLKYFGRTMTKRARMQGIGLHSQEEVTHLMTKYMKCASVALGNRKFFGGDEPCQEDCGIFGMLGQCMWALHDSPYEKLLHGECKNLKDYLIRMKEKAWPDWDELISSR